MQCPQCAIPLNMAERCGIEIDYCPQCRGVWLDRGELDKIIERSSQPPSPAPNAAARPYGHPTGQALEGIVPLVEETSRQVERIALAAEEQSAANAAINEHIRDVDAVSRETALGVEGSKQASAALAAMARDLKKLAQAGVPAAA